MNFEAPYRDVTDVDVDALLARLESAPPIVTVVIPVYNAAKAVEECIASVLRHAGPGMEILVVDDASPDPATVALLDGLAADGLVTLLRHEHNQGFTRTANDGILAAGSNDVILLNSDTVVGPMWWQRMRWVAYSLDKVATVSAVSDNAGRVSIPVINGANEWHPERAWDDVARLVAQRMYVWDQEWPLAAGFCLYLTRGALDEIGHLDDVAFPRGYGEETDFARRAMNAGYTNRLAPHVLVKHARSESFGDDERHRLVGLAKPIIAQRYPRRLDDMADWVTSPGNHLIRIVAERLRGTAADSLPQPRTASVTHTSPTLEIATCAVIDGIEAVDVSTSVPASVAQRIVDVTRTLGLPFVNESGSVSD